jgi:hypothetical protein
MLPGDFLAPSLLSSLDHAYGMIDCLNRYALPGKLKSRGWMLFFLHDALLDCWEAKCVSSIDDEIIQKQNFPCARPLHLSVRRVIRVL